MPATRWREISSVFMAAAGERFSVLPPEAGCALAYYTSMVREEDIRFFGARLGSP